MLHVLLLECYCSTSASLSWPLCSVNEKIAVLLLQYLGQFELAPVFSEEEVRHWFTPHSGIVDSYVVEVSDCTHILAELPGTAQEIRQPLQELKSPCMTQSSFGRAVTMLDTTSCPNNLVPFEGTCVDI